MAIDITKWRAEREGRRRNTARQELVKLVNTSLTAPSVNRLQLEDPAYSPYNPSFHRLWLVRFCPNLLSPRVPCRRRPRSCTRWIRSGLLLIHTPRKQRGRWMLYYLLLNGKKIADRFHNGRGWVSSTFSKWRSSPLQNGSLPQELQAGSEWRTEPELWPTLLQPPLLFYPKWIPEVRPLPLSNLSPSLC